MYNQNNKPQQAQSFGSVQENFRYRINNFNSGDQFSIVEDMQKNKPVRCETNRITGEKNGKKYDFDAKTYLIRIVSRGYEADIELKPKDLMTIAVLCPKGLENFKGATFVFDGFNWTYMGIETPAAPQAPISSISQAMRDPRQPDLNSAPVRQQADQKDVALSGLVEKVSEYNSLGVSISTQILMVAAEKLLPGDALGLISYGKSKGMISEHDGKWQVN